jgi:hypothetical protein
MENLTNQINPNIEKYKTLGFLNDINSIEDQNVLCNIYDDIASYLLEIDSEEKESLAPYYFSMAYLHYNHYTSNKEYFDGKRLVDCISEFAIKEGITQDENLFSGLHIDNIYTYVKQNLNNNQ